MEQSECGSVFHAATFKHTFLSCLHVYLRYLSVLALRGQLVDQFILRKEISDGLCKPFPSCLFISGNKLVHFTADIRLPNVRICWAHCNRGRVRCGLQRIGPRGCQRVDPRGKARNTCIAWHGMCHDPWLLSEKEFVSPWALGGPLPSYGRKKSDERSANARNIQKLPIS